MQETTDAKQEKTRKQKIAVLTSQKLCEPLNEETQRKTKISWLNVTDHHFKITAAMDYYGLRAK